MRNLSDYQGIPNILGWADNREEYGGEKVDPREAAEAVRGLSGLIVLGNAWESIDIFHTLKVALQYDSTGFPDEPMGGRNSLAYFAWLRSVELVDNDKKSLLPDAPEGEALKKKLGRPGFVDGDKVLDPTFRNLRDEAERWGRSRDAYMMERLEKGGIPTPTSISGTDTRRLGRLSCRILLIPTFNGN